MKNFKINNSLLKQLLPMGIIYFVVGIFLSYMVFTENEYRGLGVLIAIFFGAILGFAVSFMQSGGSLTFYFTVRKQTKDEIEIDMLIKQHRSNIAIIFVTLAFIGVAFVVKSDTSSIFNSFNMLGLAFLSFAGTGMLCNGTKFISAWIKFKLGIKNNL